MRFIPLFLLLPLIAGCQKYGYDLVQPPTTPLHITSNDWQHLSADPVSYRFRAMENHLIVQIYNSDKSPLRLLGDRSYIITPANQSIPLPTQSIAPGTFVKLILPPVEQITHPGPSIGFGFGYSTGRLDPPAYDDPSSEPRYLSVETPETDWEWTGETNVTLHLTFQPNDGKPFEQNFVFHRAKL